MADRTVIEWDKDDLDELGLLKVDVLGLGMLSALRRGLALVSDFRRKSFTLADIPKEDPRVYEMISRADTIGVFQVESRAQMSMLPRLQPKEFYDLVIEVAIVRPGPIQGGMVHPYLRRRQGLEPVTYPSDAVKGVLSRTLGVPIFQEQVMQLAIVAAGFTPGEADQLRRSMAAWKRRGGLGHFEQRLIDGMRARGYDESFARQIFSQIQGFGEYGFPESHAASFALLVYSSAWLKCHEPAAFTCALINSQPMGFYAPAQLVRDARDHGVEVRPISVCSSHWDCTLERRGADDETSALRLGLRLVKGLNEEAAQRIVAARVQAEVRECAGPHAAREPCAPRTRSAGGRGRVARVVGKPSSHFLAGGRQRAGAAARARAARGRRHTLARPAHRRAEHRRGLPHPGPHAGAPSAGTAACRPLGRPHRHLSRSARPAAWARGPCGRHRHGAPAPAECGWRHVHHARGRNRQREPHRLGTRVVEGAAHRQWLEAARSRRHAAERGAGHPRGGAEAVRSNRMLGTIVTQSRDFR